MIKRAGRLPNLKTDASAAIAYFESVHRSFLTAADAVAPVPPQQFNIGAHVVRVQLAGTALNGPLTRSFAHVRAEYTASPALTICAWDSESTGVAIPEPPWPVAEYVAREQMWGFRTDGIFGVCEFADGARLSLVDIERGLALYWTPTATTVPYYERTTPFLRILHWWFRARGLQFTHAAAVGFTHAGVLLGGKAGAGKSTTTLACISAGLGWAGEDYVLLSAPAPAVAHSIYCSAKLHASHLRERLPGLLGAVTNRERMQAEKAVFQLDELYPQRLLTSVPVRAVLLPAVRAGTASRLVEVSPAVGVLAIAPSTLFQLRWTGPDDLSAITAVVQSVPNYRFELGSDLRGVAAAVSSLLGD